MADIKLSNEVDENGCNFVLTQNGYTVEKSHLDFTRSK